MLLITKAKFLLFLFIVILNIVNPLPGNACVKGMEWGMDAEAIEHHVDGPMTFIRNDFNTELYEVVGLKISGLEVEKLQLRINKESGLNYLAYQINSDNMTEVLAGLRHRFGTPVSTSVDVNSNISQQQWIWHTGEDVITALKSDNKPFILAYRPPLIDPAYL